VDFGWAKGGAGVGFVLPQFPVNTPQTRYGVVEVGVAQQTCKPSLGPSAAQCGAGGACSNIATVRSSPTFPTPPDEVPINTPNPRGGEGCETTTLPPPYGHPKLNIPDEGGSTR
jgi:hypothetical protein